MLSAKWDLGKELSFYTTVVFLIIFEGEGWGIGKSLSNTVTCDEHE